VANCWGEKYCYSAYGNCPYVYAPVLQGWREAEKNLRNRVIAVNKREVSPTEKRKFGVSRVTGSESLDDLLSQSHYVSRHLHLTPETRHIIDAQRLAALKKEVF
jgi:lactate dehydrogenase-like 2-hydroxyacid dehydrogenase